MIRCKKQMTYSTIFFSIAIILLIITFCFNLQITSTTTLSAHQVAHTYQVKEQIQRLFSDVKDAERGQRGYLLTSDPSYLTLYHSAITDEQKTYANLRQLIRDNLAQAQNLSRTNNLIQARLNTLQHVLDIQQRSGTIAAREVIRQSPGKKLMDAIAAQTQIMLHEEGRLLDIRKKSFAQHKNETAFFSVLFFVMSIVPLIIGYCLLHASHSRSLQLLMEKNTYAEQLEQSNDELALVATIASHDLKAPLRKIHFFSDEILKDKNNTLSPESIDFFHRMQTATEKMSLLIEHVLSIARRKTSEMPIEAINLGQLASEVARTMEAQIQETNGQVEIGEMCSIQADKYELAQLLQNLIENGLKYHRPGVPPKIQITAHRDAQGDCEIRIKDNGIGLEKKHQHEIFKLFKRLPNAKHESGYGVGLATVDKIVAHHQGSIRVESSPNEGAEFIVNLPALQLAER